VLAAGPIHDELQAQLAISRVAQQPPAPTSTSLLVRTTTTRLAGSDETPARIPELRSSVCRHPPCQIPSITLASAWSPTRSHAGVPCRGESDRPPMHGSAQLRCPSVQVCMLTWRRVVLSTERWQVGPGVVAVAERDGTGVLIDQSGPPRAGQTRGLDKVALSLGRDDFRMLDVGPARDLGRLVGGGDHLCFALRTVPWNRLTGTRATRWRRKISAPGCSRFAQASTTRTSALVDLRS
jgi:hypothetical protein